MFDLIGGTGVGLMIYCSDSIARDRHVLAVSFSGRTEEHGTCQVERWCLKPTLTNKRIAVGWRLALYMFACYFFDKKWLFISNKLARFTNEDERDFLALWCSI